MMYLKLILFWVDTWWPLVWRSTYDKIKEERDRLAPRRIYHQIFMDPLE